MQKAHFNMGYPVHVHTSSLRQEALNFVVSASLCKAVEPEGQFRGVDFGISVHPISTEVGSSYPPEYYLPLRIFRLSASLCDDVSSVSAAFQSKIAYLAENSLLVDLFRQTAGS